MVEYLLGCFLLEQHTQGCPSVLYLGDCVNITFCYGLRLPAVAGRRRPRENAKTAKQLPR